MKRLLVAMGVALLGWSSAEAAGARQVRVDEWRTVCWPGRDGFAVNCRASAERGGLALRLSAADSQLYANIAAAGCEGGAGANFWRDELIGLKPAERRRKVEAAFRGALTELAETCPDAGAVRLVLENVPDLAVVGDPPPRWAQMLAAAPEDAE